MEASNSKSSSLSVPHQARGMLAISFYSVSASYAEFHDLIRIGKDGKGRCISGNSGLSPGTAKMQKQFYRHERTQTCVDAHKK